MACTSDWPRTTQQSARPIFPFPSIVHPHAPVPQYRGSGVEAVQVINGQAMFQLSCHGSFLSSSFCLLVGCSFEQGDSVAMPDWDQNFWIASHSAFGNVWHGLALSMAISDKLPLFCKRAGTHICFPSEMGGHFSGLPKKKWESGVPPFCHTVALITAEFVSSHFFGHFVFVGCFLGVAEELFGSCLPCDCDCLFSTWEVVTQALIARIRFFFWNFMGYFSGVLCWEATIGHSCTCNS